MTELRDRNYSKPWYFGYLGFRRRWLPTDNEHPRPTKPPDAFPHMYCSEALTALKLGSPVGIGARNKEKKCVDEYFTVPALPLGFRGSPLTRPQQLVQNDSERKIGLLSSQGGPRNICPSFRCIIRKKNSHGVASTFNMAEKSPK